LFHKHAAHYIAGLAYFTAGEAVIYGGAFAARVHHAVLAQYRQVLGYVGLRQFQPIAELPYRTIIRRLASASALQISACIENIFCIS